MITITHPRNFNLSPEGCEVWPSEMLAHLKWTCADMGLSACRALPRTLDITRDRAVYKHVFNGEFLEEDWEAAVEC